ncbi:hypothetical protein M3M39_07340 [Fructilactobacillus hinvesii]|uniref:DUF3923 family protein n=1 Tax=Fructilactobacillus hinvesii TaxID=2940300 RepID=A0ABY5BS12_9LACO|nr:hypothetical protein [Fructilactobacillus hinvesii]USS87892.1 hypothetical protein M3M39_07340 [Fructilactobacillus hinvesii]
MKRWKAMLVIEILSLLVLISALTMRHPDAVLGAAPLPLRLTILVLVFLIYGIIFALQYLWYRSLQRKQR